MDRIHLNDKGIVKIASNIIDALNALHTCKQLSLINTSPYHGDILNSSDNTNPLDPRDHLDILAISESKLDQS